MDLTDSVNKKVGIVGLGQIGKKFAIKAKIIKYGYKLFWTF